MEKYGVDVQPGAEKTAETERHGTCRDCRSTLIESANVPHCPRCGTRPYEPKTKR